MFERAVRVAATTLLLATSICAGQAPSTPDAGTVALPLSVFGEVRTRSEWMGATASVSSDAFTYLRSRLGIRIDASPDARIVLQGQDSRVFGAEGSASPSATAVDVFDLHQGYLELTTSTRGIATTIRAGRQEIVLGNERLVGAGNWTNTGRSFDGARIIVAPRSRQSALPWSTTVFVANVEERGPHFGSASAAGAPSAADHVDHMVAGAYVTRLFARASMVDATVLYDRDASYRAYDGATRATIDTRLRSDGIGDLPLRGELEVAYQGGRQRVSASAERQDVRAWLGAARLGTTPMSARHATVAIGVDALSGDATPTDGRYTAFSTMFATNHPFYGLMDVIGDPAATTKERGLVDALATGSIAGPGSSTLRAELHHFGLATGADRSLGWETDLGLVTRVNRAATIDFGFSAFDAGDGAAAVGLGRDRAPRRWIYLQMAVAF